MFHINWEGEKEAYDYRLGSMLLVGVEALRK